MDGRCQSCKWAEHEYCEGAGPGFPRGFDAICGCLNPKAENMEWDDDWGEDKDCPIWEEYIEPEEPDYDYYVSYDEQ